MSRTRSVSIASITTVLLLIATLVTATPPAAAVSAAPIPSGFPNASNTGLTNPGALTVRNGNHDIRQDGAVIQNLEIRGRVNVWAKNVVMRNVWVHSDGGAAVQVRDGGSLIIEDSEIGHSSQAGGSGVFGNNVTVRRVNIHHQQDGIFAGDNSLYERVYCHDLMSDAHADCFQDVGHSNYTIRSSTLDGRFANGATANAAIIIKSDFGPISNVVVEGNYLNGGNLIVMVDKGSSYAAPKNILIRENAFGRDVRFPPGVLLRHPSATITWQNNYWANNGQFIDWDGNPTSPQPIEEGKRPCRSGSCDSVGVVDAGGRWRLYSALSADASINSFYFGNPGDIAFMGDWNGNGTATPGLYRQSDGLVYLRNSNSQGAATTTFFFGNPGDIPLVGDFNGNGKDTVSIYRRSQGRVYVINQLGRNGGGLGPADYSFFFGNPGDAPFVGDFNGNGKDSVGLYRPSKGFVYFRYSLTQGNADLSFYYGNPGDVIMAGDWDGDGDDTVAVYRPSAGRIYVNLANSSGAANYTLFVGGYPSAVGWGR
jgi:hypothetical protein